MKKKLLIVDDHSVFRASMIAYLKNFPDLEIVGEAGDGDSIPDMIENLNPDILLLDIELPSINGIDLANEIRKKFPEVKILILSMHINPNFIFEALKSGFEGYVTKMSDIEEVIKAIEVISGGNEYYSKDVSQYAMQNYQNYHSKNNHKDEQSHHLTKREKEIIKHIVEGLSYKDIAHKLKISQYTVINHRQNIIQKLGFKSNAELIRFALKENIVK